MTTVEFLTSTRIASKKRCAEIDATIAQIDQTTAELAEKRKALVATRAEHINTTNRVIGLATSFVGHELFGLIYSQLMEAKFSTWLKAIKEEFVKSSIPTTLMKWGEYDVVLKFVRSMAPTDLRPNIPISDPARVMLDRLEESLLKTSQAFYKELTVHFRNAYKPLESLKKSMDVPFEYYYDNGDLARYNMCFVLVKA